MNRTAFVKIVGKSEDNQYITYAIELLDKDEQANIGTKHMTCVQCPGWQTREIWPGEVGYLEYQENIAGSTTWFDGMNKHYHNYTFLQFLKFTPRAKCLNSQNSNITL